MSDRTASSGDPTGRRSDKSVAIIGLGSAGEAAARQLARSGTAVVGFESNRVGGECPFTACMPSKSMLHDAHRFHPDAGPGEGDLDAAWRAAVDRRAAIVDHLDDSDHAKGLESEGVEIVRARARLAEPKVVEADGTLWEVDHVILATGSAPIVPDIDGVDRSRIWTADDALTSDRRPRSIMILGAGPIGCELGDLYRAFGARVIVVDHDDALLEDHDSEVGRVYEDQLRDKGIEFQLGTEVSSVEHRHDGTGVTLENGSSVTVDQLLIAVGQSPRVDGLGLEELGLDPESGFDLDETFRVDGHRWLSVLGDVNGRSPWTHGANRHAAIAVDRINGTHRDRTDAPMPRCVFSEPAAAHVGETVAEIEARGSEAIRGTARFSDVARFATDELDDGLVVLTVDGDDGTIVGFSGVGPRVDDLVSTATALVHSRVHIDTARTQVFPFPTISQVLEQAIDDAASRWDELDQNGDRQDDR